MRRRASEKEAQEKSAESVVADRSALDRALEASEADEQVLKGKQEERKREAPTVASDLKMPGGFERIITHQFQDIDPYEEYMELRASLRTKDGRASGLSFGELQDALDVAADNAQRGAELASRANVVLVEFNIDADVIESALRTQATYALEELKAEWKRQNNSAGKQITNDDVKAYIVKKAPDEWATLQSKKAKAEEHCKLMKSLAERLSEREKDLRQMVARSRAVD